MAGSQVMLIAVLLELLVLFTIAHAANTRDCSNVIEVTSTLQPEECSNTSPNTTCNSLQSAVDSVASESSVTCVTIRIPPGEHFITSPTTFPADVSVDFVGVGDGATILCDYEAVFPGPVDYTWYFNWSNTVAFENLDFVGCPYPFRLDTVGTVSIRNCSFRYFLEAVLDIFNCQNVTLFSLEVQHNRASGIVMIPYRGNTGGVSVGFNDIPSHLSAPSVEISHCIISNSSATASSTFLTSSQAFRNQFFTGRGGGMGVFINESFHNVTVSILDCTFEHNFARSFGGGLYIIFNGIGTQHFVTVDRSYFLSNFARLGGGGVQLSYISDGVPGTPHMGNFTDCHFENNTGEAGGGIYVYPSFQGGAGNFMKMERCSYVRNHGVGSLDDYGAAVAVSLLNLFVRIDTLPRHEIVDCTFTNNSGANGIFSVGYAPLLFRGTNNFTGNIGTALRIVGTLVNLYGTVNFIGNTDFEGSALHILSFGQLFLTRGLTINFIGNVGSFGAAILIDTPTSSIAFNKLLYNPQCFFLYEDLDTSPSDWTDVDISFEGNVAVLGSAILASRLETCSWFSLQFPFFNNSYLLDWPIWTFGNNTNTGYEDQHSSLYYVETTAEELETSPDSVALWPGQRFSLSLTGRDQFDHLTSVNARFIFSGSGDSQDASLVKIMPEVVVVAPNSENGTLTRQFTLTYAITNSSVLEDNSDTLGVVGIEVPFETQPVSTDNFALRTLPCPGGYILIPSSSIGGQVLECQCKDNPEIIQCEADQDTVVIERGQWAAYVPVISGPNLEFYPCPSGYCKCSQNTSVGSSECVYAYTNSDPDRQCVCGRKGILCGECRNDTGVSALLDKCVSCNDASGLLILALIIADTVVFVGLVLLDIPVPAWVYPFLFYFQVAPYVAQYFPDSFETGGKYLQYLSSALSFYFVYDFCLYDGTSAHVAYFLRYIPLFIALLVVPAVALIRRYKRLKPLQNHGVWWILLMLYSHVVYTSMSILNCPRLRARDGVSTIRWFVSGEVQCFTGGHIPLALLAMAILFLSFVLSPLAVVLSLRLLKRPLWLRHLVRPLTVSFRSELRWWSSVELGRRFLFLLFLIPFPRNSASPLLVLCVIVTVYGFAQPYKSWTANVLEMTIQIVFLLMLLIRATSQIQDIYFVFPSPSETFLTQAECSDSLTGIATICIILLPFYYLPLAIFGITSTVYITLLLRKKIRARTKRRDTVLPSESSEYVSHKVFTQSLRLDVVEGSDSGYITLGTNQSSIPDEYYSTSF